MRTPRPIVVSLCLAALLAAGAAEARAADGRERALSGPEISAKLGRLGAQIVQRERRLAKTRREVRVRRSETDASQVQLAGAQERLRQLTLAAQRLAREPAAAMLLEPGRPLEAARSAMLMRRLRQELAAQEQQRAEADHRLQKALTAAERAQAKLLDDLEALRKQELAVKRLQKMVKRSPPRRASQPAAAPKHLLKGLRKRAAQPPKPPKPAKPAMAAKIVSAPTAPPALARPPSPPAPATPKKTPRPAPAEATRIVQAEKKKTTPRPQAKVESPKPKSAPKPRPLIPVRRAFAKSRGQLLWPAAGDMRRSGRKAEPGVSLFTAPYARVIAPFHGKVMHAESFGHGEKIVIIEPQKGYSILMIGMESIDVDKGQKITAGQPIGRMGGPARLRGQKMYEERTGAMKRSEKLYLEIYRRERALDPAPWFRSATERVSGL